MHANVQLRFNPAIGKEAPYYRLKESYRDVRGVVHSLIVLNIGFEPSLSPLQVKRIASALTSRFKHRHERTLFDLPDNLDGHERAMAETYWSRMQDEGGIDHFDSREKVARKEAEDYIDINTVSHTDARNVGAEWLCRQAIDSLEIEQFLRSRDWTENDIHTALSHLIVRTVYSPSELSTYHIMRDNSAACELCGNKEGWLPGLNSLYRIPDRLLEMKEDLERYLCNRTDTLFNLENRIMLFDLTNFYFEGRKAVSQKARFGRSKEKRSDCRLLVLALCINKEGFIRYSSVLEGNMSDPKSLPDMAEKLIRKTGMPGGRSLVVIDAGISTEDNLRLLKRKGLNYLCVSRIPLKNYELSANHQSVTVKDARKQDITLRRVHTAPGGDYYLEITSPSKAMTGSSMNRLFRSRFEEELTKAASALEKKSGVKKYEKVIERVGRAIQKYPSVSRYYDIEYTRSQDKPQNMGRIDWSIRDLSAMEKGHGVYFLRTNVEEFDEKTTWDYYNLIREIETTNRQLKTDLNLRPIYHQKDGRSDAHIFFGLLSYWVVNTIRYQLKQKGIKCYWTEIVRRVSTQKLVTTEAVNALGEKVRLRQCSRPSEQAREIYTALNYRQAPFKKKQICRSQQPPD